MSLRYTEAREQSAAILRLVIQEMGQHDAAFNPLSFAVWYEHLAGINPRLSQALTDSRKSRPKLDDATVQSLYREHVAAADEATANRIGASLQQVMSAIAESAAQAGSQAGQFGHQLNDLSRALAADDPSQLAPQVDQARAGTEQMRASVQSLQSRLSSSAEEVSRLRAELQRVREDALIDPLSGVLNRKGFEQALARMIGQGAGNGRTLCLVLLDLDHFKRVNDTHGHLVGDSVIRGLGQVLKKTSEETGHTSARYGGEEFAVLAHVPSLEQAVQVAELVRTRTKSLKVRNRTTNEVLLTPTVSAGVAAWAPGDDAAALIAAADGALYRSKQNGRDRVSVA